jgi:hypothetical protein
MARPEHEPQKLPMHVRTKPFQILGGAMAEINKTADQLLAEVGNCEPSFILGLRSLLGIPESAVGLLWALRGIIIALERLRENLNISGFSEILNEISSLNKKLLSSQDLPNYLRAPIGPKVANSPVKLMLAVINASGSEFDSQIQMIELVGAVILSHLASGKPMPNSRSEQLTALLLAPGVRTKNQAALCNFSARASLDPEVMAQAAEPDGSDVLRELAAWLVSVLKHIRHRKLTSLTNIGGAESEKISNDFGPASSAELAGDEDDDPGPLTNWSYMRAIRCSVAASAGFSTWNILNPDELRREVLRLQLAIEKGLPVEVRLACLAIISLITCLPIKKLRRLGFKANGDIWLDLESNSIVRSLSRLVRRVEVAPDVQSNGYQPSDLICLPLPPSVVFVLQELCDQSAELLVDRMFPDMSRKDLERIYGAFLRGHAQDPRKAYSARFSYSLGATILAVTGDSIAAAYASSDFRHLAPAEVDYLCFPSTKIRKALSDAYQWLGLGTLEIVSTDEYVGSPLAPRPEIYKAAIGALVSELQTLVNLSATESFDGFVEIFNRRASCFASLFVLLTGDRGSAFERRTVAALLGHPAIGIIFDKDTESSAERPVPLTKAVQGLLNAYLGDVFTLAQCARKAGFGRIADKLTGIAERRLERSSLFVHAGRTGEGVPYLSPIRASTLRAKLEVCGLALNGGRHFLLGALYDVPHLRRALSGHGSKATATFHHTSGLIRLEVLNELRSVLEKFESAYSLPEVWLSLGTAPKASLVALDLSKKISSGDVSLEAFTRFQPHNSGKKSRVIGLDGSAKYSLGRAILERFICRPLNGLGNCAATLISLAIVDGLPTATLCREAWEILSSRQSVQLLKTCWCEIKHASGRIKSFSPLPPTLMYLSRHLESDQKESFEVACAQISSWLSREFPTMRWPESGLSALSVLGHLSRHIDIFELPCWIVTSEAEELGAASISVSALARLAYRKPIRDTEVPRASYRRQKNNGDWSIGAILTILNQAASSAQRRGEEKARKQFVKKEIANRRHQSLFEAPMVTSVVEYVLEETEDRPIHGEPIEIASLANCIRTLRRVLEQELTSSPIEWGHPEWLTVETYLMKQVKPGENYDEWPLRRFARYWRAQGADVPRALFPNGSDDVKQRPERSAASTVIWWHEWQSIYARLVATQRPGSVGEDIYRAFLQLIYEFPQRGSETHYLRLIDLDDDNPILTVTSSGFSHLKGGELSRRPMTLSKECWSRLNELRKRLKSLSPSREYFFFEGDAPTKDKEFMTMITAVSSELKAVTGDRRARRHMLRGVAECRMLLPNFDEFAQAVMAGEAPIIPRQSQGSESWQQVVGASAEAGHHPLTAVANYLSVGSLIARQYRLLRLRGLWPSATLTQFAGISPGNARIIKCRSERKDSGTGLLWRRLADTIDLKHLCQGAIDFASSAPSLPEVEPDSGIENTERKTRAIWAYGLMTSGLDEQGAIDLSQTLDTAILRHCKESQSGDQRKHGKDTLRLMRLFGLPVAHQVAALGDASHFRRSWDALNEVARVQPATLEDQVSALESLMLVLPKDWGICFLPEKEGLTNNVAVELRSTFPSIFIKPPSRDIASRFRFSVTAPGTSLTSPRSQGAANNVLRAILNAAILIGQKLA